MAVPRPNTHLGIDPRYSGWPLELAPGRARVALDSRPEMVADDHGLVHGGFVFSLADYAAMLAVDHPNVVLGEARLRFLAPLRLGERAIAEAEVVEEDGKKRQVEVTVRRAEPDEPDTVIASGRLTCFVLPRHVLAGRPAEEGR